MPDAIDIKLLQVAAFRIPTITAYNRLEAVPRIADFDRSLKAEIRDPLWMLTRQWQFGEFQGEDAASAIGTKIDAGHTVMDRVFFPNSTNLPYDGKVPLETTVEREQLSGSLSLAVQMARYFIKLIPNFAGSSTFQALLTAYPLNYTPADNDTEGKQLLQAASGKIFDGFAFYNDVLAGPPTALGGAFGNETGLFKAWYQRTYSQPAAGTNSSWQPSQLDYNFQLASSLEQPAGKKLKADHYGNGRLDWYSFDINGAPATIGVTLLPGTGKGVIPTMQSYIPSPVKFKGMPNPRFWMMEENQTDFGKIDTSPTGLLHLLLAEFGLIYSNDWFLLPYQLPVNTLCEINGILVSDVFGEYTLVRPAGRAAESNWQRWVMYHHTEINNNAANGSNLFYLVPNNNTLEGEPLEQVNFLRDEMADLVWGIEKIVPTQAGKGVNGDEMAIIQAPAASVNANASISYVLGTTVPENWIPFIPVKQNDSQVAITLQRAKLPGSKGPIGSILSEKAAPYYIDNEVIPRSGVVVSRSWQMARGPLGSTNLWIGRKKTNGKGEGWSNLKFDQVKNNS